MKMYPVYSLIAISLVFLSLIGISYGAVTHDGTDPIYIGVLLPLTGPDGKPIHDAINLAKEQINRGGGIGGHPLELILRDTRTGDIQTYAQELAQDKRIRVVVGPFSSDELFGVAGLFIDNYKVLVSPTASSDEIFRAFGTTGSVWRTISSDGDITSVIMQHLKKTGAKNVALLVPKTSYGKTFWDWVPFWGIETGISIVGAEEYSSPDQIQGAITNLTRNNPDYLIFVHSGDSSEIITALDALLKLKSPVPLYLVYPGIDDQGQILERMSNSSLFASLVSGQWILQNSTISGKYLPDETLILLPGIIEDDFIQDYELSQGTKPSGYAPQAYDGLLVAAGIMARFSANSDKSPKNAAQTIFQTHDGEPLPRTIEGIQDALNGIIKNQSVIMTGATGPLTFKSDGTDRLVPRFETYQIEGGRAIPDPLNFVEIEKSLSDGGEDETELVDYRPETGQFTQENYWAVIGALSRDWENYRHQADALTIYQYVKSQGIPDDHIILLVYDDIPVDKKNVKPGEVYHTPGETEVRKYANPDYIGDKVNKQMLEDILYGTKAFGDTQILQSDENSTVLLYLSSHGAPGGYLVLGEGEELISPEEFRSVIKKMSEHEKFGRMLVVLESCFSGATASDVTIPGVVVLTAASNDETSKAATYDSGLSNWLSDEFTNQIVSLLTSGDPKTPLFEFYHTLYTNVRSSHPMLIGKDESRSTSIDIFFGGEV